MDPNQQDEAIREVFRLAPACEHHYLLRLAQEDHLDLTQVRNSKSQTLLHVAAGYGRRNLVMALIDLGADVNSRDEDGQAPLHNAACHGHCKTSKKLIEAGADINLADNRGWTPLHFALGRKDNARKIGPHYRDVVELLLNCGADPYLKTNSGRSCLSQINDSQDAKEVRMMHLLHKLDNLDPLSSASARNATIDRYLQVSDFFELVKIGDDQLDALETLATPHLINSRLSTCNGISPLHRAAGYNQINTARFFISQGADVNATDLYERIPLHNAAEFGHTDMIDLLVKEGCDINKQDSAGYSPLHLAATNKTFHACKDLCDLGADLNLKCHEGKIPFDLAEAADVKEVLCPMGDVRVIPSSSNEAAVYIDIRTAKPLDGQESNRDILLFDSYSEERLFANTSHNIKKETLKENDYRYQLVKQRMVDSIRVHSSDLGGSFSDYEIVRIELLLNQPVWTDYKKTCERLERIYGQRNEKMLFHGSNKIDSIMQLGFDEKHAKRNGMFGAGIYFAQDSSKSNQYVYEWGQGCKMHKDKSCYICERNLIYAQVALGRSLVSKTSMPENAHAPPGHSSVSGLPGVTENLMYPEFVIYQGAQAYPLFVIKYRIKA